MPLDYRCSPSGTVVKGLPANAGEATDARDKVSIPGLGRFPGVGISIPHQYSCLENSMDRGAWQATVPGVAKSWTRLNTCMLDYNPQNKINIHEYILM